MRKLIYLSCFTILLTTAFCIEQLHYLVFFAFIPVLRLFDEFVPCKKEVLKLSFLVFGFLFIANSVITNWVYSANSSAAFLIHLLNALFLSVPFVLFFTFKDSLKSSYGFLLFFLSWLSIEHLHSFWIFSFPFLNLGYSISVNLDIIQFYEYSGVVGGSAWIFLVNFSLYQIHKFGKKLKLYHILGSLFVVIGPVLVSVLLKSHSTKGDEEVYASIYHTSIPCLDEKYNKTPIEVTQGYISEISKSNLDYSSLLVMPETALTDVGFLPNIRESPSYVEFEQAMFENANAIDVITGAISFSTINTRSNEIGDPNIIDLPQYPFPFRMHNSVILVKSKKNVNEVLFRSKEKLVPVEETIPNNFFFRLLRHSLGSLGGFKFSETKYGEDIFTSSKGHSFLPLICYESAFGSFVRRKVLKGAQFITISLNECWYQGTKGTKQFQNFAVCRAIENRRYVAKSSNFGISSFINSYGEVMKSTESDKPQMINGKMFLNNQKTFYMKYGDMIGVSASFLTLIILSFALGSTLMIRLTKK